MIEDLGNHQVDSVFHENLVGIDDKKLNQICLSTQRILITLDTDFIHIIEPFFGIIVLRSRTQGKKAVKKIFELFLENFPVEEVAGKIIIIEPDQIRIRY